MRIDVLWRSKGKLHSITWLLRIKQPQKISESILISCYMVLLKFMRILAYYLPESVRSHRHQQGRDSRSSETFPSNQMWTSLLLWRIYVYYRVRLLKKNPLLFICSFADFPLRSLPPLLLSALYISEVAGELSSNMDNHDPSTTVEDHAEKLTCNICLES